MLKKTFTLSFLILIAAVLILPYLNLAAADSNVDVSPISAVVAPNQPAQFTVKPNAGTPPFTYQWYYTYLDQNVNPEDYVRVAVPGATNETFQFSAAKPGRYGISIGWQDGDGYTGYRSFQPLGIIVTVTDPSTATPAPMTTPTATLQSTKLNPDNTFSIPSQIPTGIFIASIITIVMISAAAIIILNRKRKSVKP